MSNKVIAYIPIHIKYKDEKDLDKFIRELATMEFERTNGISYSQKRKCRRADVKLQYPSKKNN